MARVVDELRFDVSSTLVPAAPIRVRTLGLALSTFFALSFVICVLGYYLLPGLPVRHEALAILLPGFEFGSWPRLLLGLGESIAWGWYVALAFGSIYNFFAARAR